MTTNRFPLIHSMSTVGVVKHYNQDYLLHPLRTDFTGSNGIGKSLIADLLQILFIADKKQITFGTESFKKEHRQIFTIPYKTSDAYFFINIEIEAKKYITLGVNIPNTSTSPIKVIRVLNGYYDREKEATKNLKDRKKLNELLIPEEKLPYHRDFIIDTNIIPKIDKLTKHLRDNKKLYLDVFTTKKEKKELYQFLFDKEILPINLSIDSHLTTFAKVLQAFSKANTLKTDKDKSLKSFLFEDKKTEIENEYNKNKVKLDELIDRYKQLKDLTQLLENKRFFLEGLYEKYVTFVRHEKEYFLNRYKEKERETSKLKLKWKKETEKFNQLTAEINNGEKKIPHLKHIELENNKKHDAFVNGRTHLIEYQVLQDSYKKDKNRIKKLKIYSFPDISFEKESDFDFKDLSVEDIIIRADSLKEILKKYSSLNGIEQQYNKQTVELNNYRQKLIAQKEKLLKLRNIISLKDDNSLGAQIIRQEKILTKSQETILRQYLLDVSWSKPTNIDLIDGMRYTNDIDILNEKNISEIKEDGGYWFRIGKLNRFIPYSKEEQIFNDKSSLTMALTKKEKGIAEAIKEIEEKIATLSDIEISSKIKETWDLDFTWDFDLPDKRKIKEYSDSVAMINDIDNYIQSKNDQVNDQNKNLQELKAKISFEFSEDNLAEEIDRSLNKEKKLNQKLIDSSKAKQKEETTLQLKKEELSNLNYEPNRIQELITKQQDELNQLLQETNLKYPSLITDNELKPLNKSSLDEIQEVYFEHKKTFEIKYKQSVDFFKEIGDDIEVKEQIENKTYDFTVLERKLLGNSILETKNIEQALNGANEEKSKMSSTLREIMLKIFQKTQNEYENYKSVTAKLNVFFKNKLISDKYYFQVKFTKDNNFSVNWINDLQSKAQTAGDTGELFESESVEQFVESFFIQASGYKKGIEFSDLLDPKTYFQLKTEFKDEDGNEYPGSTGESYTARVLLGIGRLSITSNEQRKGLRFLILEEVSSLDALNFNTFPELAERFGYQIITMTPEPFGSNSDEGWYLHQLIEGIDNKDINYPIPNSSFKTNYSNEQLLGYLNKIKN